MAIFQDLITDALTEINAITPGSSIPAADLALGLTRGNAFIDSANGQALMLGVTRLDTLVLPSQSQSYTIGPTGVITSLGYRPNDIIAAAIVDTGQTPNVFIHCTVVPDYVWEAYSVLGYSTSVPTQLWYQQTYPDGTIWLRGIPNNIGKYRLRIETQQIIGQAAGLSTAFSGPPGWYEAFMYSLAERLCNPFGKVGDIKADITARARQARANFKGTNGEIQLMELDGLKTGKEKPYFNWITGPFLQ